ncbi:histidine kinase [Chitinophaga sp. G-6-1-13]|uniref:Histidine kinase n=1 Tax=Chitinophaga fulva TaxID=2728842 RepID=A0A848GSP5_9BACT|nr:sensor histidine kinase [Chitinophaga fulva]NML38828.1 histidine kinase [Chitinophaga fulva]
MPAIAVADLLKKIISQPRISYWKVIGWLAVLQIVINAKTYYVNSHLKDPVLRAGFLSWISSWTYLLQQLLSCVLVSLLCFTVFNLFYHLSARKARLPVFLAAGGLLFALYLVIDQGINYFFYPETFSVFISNPLALTSDILLGVTIITVLTVIVVKVAISNDVSKRNKQLELDKREAEYELLKAQVNPHFLFNSLNYLYARSLPYSKELSEGIMTLSEIMRYAFDTHGKEGDGRVLLKNEVEYIGKFLKMNELRFGVGFYASFEQRGAISGWRIIPFVLITMVENAVKHADATNALHPIRIHLEVTEDTLVFSCKNQKKPRNMAVPSTKVGIPNMKERLRMAYGDNHELLIEDTADTYFIKLTLRNGH